MIPDNIIEDIKAKNDISDVISAYVTLRKAGANMNGLCPFHNEKTPSFTVFPGTQSFYCFGCRAGGDVVTFIRKTENLEYAEAVRFLAKRSGVDIPEESDGQRRGVRKSRILEMNKEAARFFRSTLLTSDEAKSYVIKRGLGKSIVSKFGIGYASGKSGDLITHLKKLGYTEDEMLIARLVGKNERGYYPYFRNRIMFPIIDTAGSVIAFGGRVTDNSKPKYLNTPDTVAFNKGKNLFALNYAKNHAAEEIILCEGYMDVIALHAAGFENAVATLGTAITQEQARLIKRYTNKVVLAYDGDGAGQSATDRASRILSEVGIDVRILRLKDAKDPDEYIKLFGPSAFRLLLKGSETKFDFIMKNITDKYDVATDDGKIKAANALCLEIANISSSVEQELYTEKASKVLGISKQSLENEIKKQMKKRAREKTVSFKRKLESKALGIGDKINPERSLNLKAAKAEEALLGIMMLYPERMTQTFSGKFDITEDDFVTSFNRRVFSGLKKMFLEGVSNVGALGSDFTSEEMGRIYEMQVKREGLDSSSEAVFTDNISALKASKATVETDIEKLIKAKISKKENM